MNYFAHGCRFLDNGYFLAGTAVPDLLSVVDRKVRTHRARATEFAGSLELCTASVAQGIVQHHHDDAWFHSTDAFNEVTWETTRLCYDLLPQDERFRPSFLGHILVELLLDAALIEMDPSKLERYYAAMEAVDVAAVEDAVCQIAGRPAKGLAWFIKRFCEVRFLCDYADDRKLIFRLNQVMRRVRLTALPESFVEVIGPAREMVSARAEELFDRCTT